MRSTHHGLLHRGAQCTYIVLVADTSGLGSAAHAAVQCTHLCLLTALRLRTPQCSRKLTLFVLCSIIRSVLPGRRLEPQSGRRTQGAQVKLVATIYDTGQRVSTVIVVVCTADKPTCATDDDERILGRTRWRHHVLQPTASFKVASTRTTHPSPSSLSTTTWLDLPLDDITVYLKLEIATAVWAGAAQGVEATWIQLACVGLMIPCKISYDDFGWPPTRHSTVPCSPPNRLL